MESRKGRSVRVRHGVSFDDVASQIERGNVLADSEHPNQERYPGQGLFVVNVRGYAYVVPYVEHETGVFLKTLYPSRKATRDYLRQAGGN